MNNTSIIPRDTKGTTSEFPATVISHYAGNMYEIRVTGGICCIDIHDFIANDPKVAQQIAAL